MAKLLISAGHSDKDPGAVAGSVTEAKLALELRDLIVKEMSDSEVTIITDGRQGENLPLRDAISQIPGTDLAVEIHFNAAGAAFAQGVEAISLPEKKGISQKISASISSVLGSRLRGDSGWIDQSLSARGKLGFVNAGGIIVEVCFITNTMEMQHYQANKAKLARVLSLTLKEALSARSTTV